MACKIPRMHFSASAHIKASHPSLFHGLNAPVDIGDGWLMLLEFTLSQIEIFTTRAEREEIQILGVRTECGEMVITADIPAHLTTVALIIDQAREASGGICVCCGGYATVKNLWSPLCRSCIH